MARTRAHRRLGRLPPVHLRLHLRPQGRGRHPRQPARQRAGHHRTDGPHPGHHRGVRPRTDRQLAADVPRHGPHRPGPEHALPRRHRHPLLPAALPPAPRPLAGGRQPVSPAHQRRPQLRLRAVSEARHSGTRRRTRPDVLEGRLQRRRTGTARHPAALHRYLRPGRPSAARPSTPATAWPSPP